MGTTLMKKGVSVAVWKPVQQTRVDMLEVVRRAIKSVIEFVNCARSEEERNMMVFQYHGEI